MPRLGRFVPVLALLLIVGCNSKGTPVAATPASNAALEQRIADFTEMLKKEEEKVPAAKEASDAAVAKAADEFEQKYIESGGKLSPAGIGVQPEGAKPEAAKPDEAKPDESKPDAAKPDLKDAAAKAKAEFLALPHLEIKEYRVYKETQAKVDQYKGMIEDTKKQMTK